MSHVLFVHGTDDALVNRLVDRGVALFRVFHRLTPTETHTRVACSVTVFPSQFCSAPQVFASQEGYTCGVGTWFYEGTVGTEALQRLSRAAARDLVIPEAALRALDGWFALLLFKDREAALITDRLGEFHVYSASIGGHTVVSTSSMVLAALTGARWDPDGCRQFLAIGSILEPSRTLFRGVTKLAPASRYRFLNGALRSATPYWSVASVAWPAMDPAGNAVVLASELRKAVSTVLRSFPRPVFDLSGGFDTRGVLGATLQLGADADFVVNGDAGDTDVVASLRLAREFGLRHTHSSRASSSAAELWHRAKASLPLCDGEQDILYYAPILKNHSKRFADGFDSTVNGNAGEVAHGHWWEVLFPFAGASRFDSRLVATRRGVSNDQTRGLMDHAFPQDLTEYLAGVIDEINKDLQGHPNTAKMDNVYVTLWEQRFYGRTISATSHLWPIISPYAFRGPLEAALSASYATRVRRRMIRRMIEHQSPKLAGLPTAGRYPAAPLRLSNAHRFWPAASEYGTLAARRVLRNLGVHGRPRSVLLPGDSGRRGALKELRQLDEVMDCTDLTRMATRDLYNGKVLSGVLAQDAHVAFGRVLTLELLARALLRAPSTRTSNIGISQNVPPKVRSVPVTANVSA
jgi:hypothetical protein